LDQFFKTALMDVKSSGNLLNKLKVLTATISKNIDEFNKRVAGLKKGTLKRTQI